MRTSDEANRFTGVEFFIEPVYQRTVAQLEEMSDLFWLAFVPLACDADEPKVCRVVQRLREEAKEEEFGALVATMLSMAQIKKDWQDLPHVIRSAASRTEGSMRHPWFCDGKEEGLKEGLEKGIVQGRVQGREKGREKGREELMRFQLERRLGRRLRASERRNLTTLLAKEGPKKLGAAVLELSAQDLETYIAPRTPRKTQKVNVM